MHSHIMKHLVGYGFWLTSDMASRQSGPLKHNFFWPQFMTSVAYALQYGTSGSAMKVLN